ncbi:MAG: hypothetical protein ABI142_06845, partial [Bryocella sp.]
PVTVPMQNNATCVASAATCGISVSPSGNFVAAVAGNSGTILYPFASGSGITSTNNPGYIASSPTNGNFSASADSSNYLYLSKTTSIESYLISSSGFPQSSSSLTTTNFTNGENPHSIVVSNGFVFTANPGNSTISSFSAAAGVLTSVGAISGPTSVYSIGIDSTGKYIVAGGANTSYGVQVFSIGSTGALSNLNQNFATSTTSVFPIVVALTHPTI